MSVSLDPRIGIELFGYRIEKVIGRGGMGVVYLAEDLRLRRPVALKVLAGATAQDAAFRRRFLEESRLAASLDHPNVVPIYAAGEASDELYIAMRYVPGPDLKNLLRRAKIEPSRAIAVCAQVAAALDAAHDRGLVHGDVKPSNVLLDGTDHVYLADFGLTRRIGEKRTLEPALLGTIDYVAPEQIRGGEVDGRADVYSLGCLLYECLTGASPFRRGSDAATLFAHLEESPPAFPALERVLQKALAKEPADRYQTAGELVDDARSSLGIPVPARSRRYLALAAIGILAAAIATLFALSFTRGDSPAVAPPGAARIVRVDPASGHVLSTTSVGADLSAVSADRTGVWVGSLKTGTLVQVDPSSGKVLESISVAGARAGPSAVAAADGLVWIVNGGDNKVRLYRADEARFSAAEPRLATAGATGCECIDLTVPAVARGDVLWTFSPAHKSLERFVADSIEQKSTTLDRRSQLTGIALGEGAVWALATTPGPALYKVDQQSNAVLAKATFPPTVAPAAVAAGAGGIWIADVAGNAVLRLEPKKPRIVARIPVGDSPVAIAVGLGFVWVANNLSGTISRIDPGTNRVTGTWNVGSWPDRLAVGDGGVWVALDPPETGGA